MILDDPDTAYDRDAEREPFTPTLSDRDRQLLSGTCWRCDAPSVGLADDGMGRYEPACANHLTKPDPHACCESGRCRACPKANR